MTKLLLYNYSNKVIKDVTIFNFQNLSILINVSTTTKYFLSFFQFYILYGSTSIWTLALFQFLNIIHNPQDSLDGGSACHKVANYTQNNTNTE
jgi:hypothetical protein